MKCILWIYTNYTDVNVELNTQNLYALRNLLQVVDANVFLKTEHEKN